MSPTSLTTSPEWTAAGWTMLHLVWVGTALGLLAAIARWLLKTARPEARYSVALVCFLALAISPVFIFVKVFEPDAQPHTPRIRRVQDMKLDVSNPTASSERSLSERPARPHQALESQVSFLGRARLDSVVFHLPWIWLAGSLTTLVMLATGLVGVERLRRSSRPVEDGELPRRCRALARSLGIARRVGVGVCDRLTVPILLGIVRPLVLLPSASLSSWSVLQLEMVLLHELAHVRRWDNLVNLMQRVLESLLFFHPVVWWLSGWVRLERESCCDRLVVERLGQPSAYAEMLVAVSGSSYRGRGALVAMADRQVLTRIRRLLNLEDRSMKLTMPEGLGVLGALVAGAVLVLGSQAGPPPPPVQSEDSIRQALRKAAEEVRAIPLAALQVDFKADTLANIAKAQLKLGDRASAFDTLRRVFESIDQFDPNEGNLWVFGRLLQVAANQREAGDLAAARASLDRLTKLVESHAGSSQVQTPVPIAEARAARRQAEELSAADCSELIMLIAEERKALGDLDEVRRLCRRACTTLESEKGVLKPIYLSAIGSRLYKAGDAAGGRNVIEQSRKAADSLSNPAEKQQALTYIALALVEIGELDAGLSLAQTLGSNGNIAAIKKIVETFAEEDFHGAWDDPGGIKIVIGATGMKLKDGATTSESLARIAQAARDGGDALVRARTLSFIANLQAMTHDFAGARATAFAIPEVRRGDFPGPSDGFYDAIKPATLAINAGLQAAADDQAGALENLREAVVLSRGISTASERLVAQIVIIQKQLASGEHDLASALLREAILFAIAQAEPVRSRALAMLVESQAKAGDAIGAATTLRAIREYPGLEKDRARGTLADWYDRTGDHAMSETFLRQSLAWAEANAPENAPPLAAKIKPPQAVAARSFVDFEYEIDPKLIARHKQLAATWLRSRLGEQEEAFRLASAMPAATRSVALSNLAGQIARKGDVAEAMKLAERIETPQERMTAFDLIAIAIRDRDAVK